MEPNKAFRPMIFTREENPDVPFTMLQTAGMEAMEDQLRKFYGWCAQQYDMFIAVRHKRDERGRLNPRVYDVYNYRNYPGMARVRFVQNVEKVAGKLTHILNVGANLRMIVKIEPDTSKVYTHHHHRPLICTFRMLTPEEMKPKFTELD